MWSSSCALIGATLAFEISLFTVPFLCIKRKSSLIIHVLFNVLDVRTPDSLLLRSTWTELYNQKDTRATLRQVWSAQLITCKKCRAMYIEYPGRRIGGKFGEHLRSVEGHHQQHLFHLHLHFLPPGRKSTVQPSGPQKKEGGNGTHFHPTFLPRGINIEFKIYVVRCNLFLALLYPSQPTRAHVVPRFILSHMTFRWRKKLSNCKVRTVQQPTNN